MSAIKKLQSATAAISGLCVEVENEHLGKIKVKPAISCAKAQEIQEAKREQGVFNGICLELVYRCMNPDGSPMFNKIDIVTMMAEIDSDALMGVFIQVSNAVHEGKSTAATSSITT